MGWIGLGPREDFPRLGRSRTIPQLPGDGVWVVNCFVVAKGARRTGVASALLEAAVTYAREHGAAIVEGYPVRTGGKRIASASAYTGTAGMFERTGFEIATETTSKASSGTPRLVMRRTPGAGRPGICPRLLGPCDARRSLPILPGPPYPDCQSMVPGVDTSWLDP